MKELWQYFKEKYAGAGLTWSDEQWKQVTELAQELGKADSGGDESVMENIVRIATMTVTDLEHVMQVVDALGEALGAV